MVPIPNFDKLREVADSGGGRYLEIDAPESSFQSLNQTAALFPENRDKSELTGDQWLDRGPWLLIPLILIAAICFRRGWLLVLLMAIFLNAETASAQNWDNLWNNLWQRPTQQAAKAFAKEEFDEAAQLSQDPDWQAAANYRAGNFKEAATALEPQTSSQAHYNRGNALAHSGELEKAIEAYDQALQADPGLEDASFNRDLVEKLLQQQEQQKQEESQNDNSEKKEQEKEDSDPNSDQNSKDQQNSEQSQDSSEQQEQKENQQIQENEQNQDNQNSQAQDQEQKETKKESEAETNKPEESPEKAQEKDVEEDEKKEPEGVAAGEEDDEKPMDAKQQALEQWLRRVPDDPQGLLQKKFLYQYRDRENRSQGHKEW